MVREYRRRCNTVENIHKVIGSWDRVMLVQETEELHAQSPKQVMLFIFIFL